MCAPVAPQRTSKGERSPQVLGALQAGMGVRGNNLAEQRGGRKGREKSQTYKSEDKPPNF